MAGWYTCWVWYCSIGNSQLFIWKLRFSHLFVHRPFPRNFHGESTDRAATWSFEKHIQHLEVSASCVANRWTPVCLITNWIPVYYLSLKITPKKPLRYIKNSYFILLVGFLVKHHNLWPDLSVPQWCGNAQLMRCSESQWWDRQSVQWVAGDFWAKNIGRFKKWTWDSPRCDCHESFCGSAFLYMLGGHWWQTQLLKCSNTPGYEENTLVRW